MEQWKRRIWRPRTWEIGVYRRKCLIWPSEQEGIDSEGCKHKQMSTTRCDSIYIIIYICFEIRLREVLKKMKDRVTECVLCVPIGIWGISIFSRSQMIAAERLRYRTASCRALGSPASPARGRIERSHPVSPLHPPRLGHERGHPAPWPGGELFCLEIPWKVAVLLLDSVAWPRVSTLVWRWFTYCNYNI